MSVLSRDRMTGCYGAQIQQSECQEAEQIQTWGLEQVTKPPCALLSLTAQG